MSATRQERRRRERGKSPSRRGPWTIAITAMVILGVAAIVVTRSGGSGAGRASSTPGASATGPMGGPVISTPGTASGVAQADGVTVENADVALGRVPLMVTVEPTWQLHNAGDGPAKLGEPHAEVVEGCCPGPLELSESTIGPGDDVTLTFPLQMHPGMDGVHEFAVHVPVQGASGNDENLTLRVTGDFRD